MDQLQSQVHRIFQCGYASRDGHGSNAENEPHSVHSTRAGADFGSSKGIHRRYLEPLHFLCYCSSTSDFPLPLTLTNASSLFRRVTGIGI